MGIWKTMTGRKETTKAEQVPEAVAAAAHRLENFRAGHKNIQPGSVDDVVEKRLVRQLEKACADHGIALEE